MDTLFYRVEECGFGGSIQQVSRYVNGGGSETVAIFQGQGYDMNRAMAENLYRILREYAHITRIWPRVMAGVCITESEWLNETPTDRAKFYTWIREQAGEYVDLI